MHPGSSITNTNALQSSCLKNGQQNSFQNILDEKIISGTIRVRNKDQSKKVKRKSTLKYRVSNVGKKKILNRIDSNNLELYPRGSLFCKGGLFDICTQNLSQKNIKLQKLPTQAISQERISE